MKNGQLLVRPNSDHGQLSGEMWQYLYQIYGGGPELIIKQVNQQSARTLAEQAASAGKARERANSESTGAGNPRTSTDSTSVANQRSNPDSASVGNPRTNPDSASTGSGKVSPDTERAGTLNGANQTGVQKSNEQTDAQTHEQMEE